MAVAGEDALGDGEGLAVVEDGHGLSDAGGIGGSRGRRGGGGNRWRRTGSGEMNWRAGRPIRLGSTFERAEEQSGWRVHRCLSREGCVGTLAKEMLDGRDLNTEAAHIRGVKLL